MNLNWDMLTTLFTLKNGIVHFNVMTNSTLYYTFKIAGCYVCVYRTQYDSLIKVCIL